MDDTDLKEEISMRVPKNKYDRYDTVRRETCLDAGGIKIAAYRVRDPETGEFSALQFHMTADNMVYAVMGENAAKLFARFVEMTINPKKEEQNG